MKCLLFSQAETLDLAGLGLWQRGDEIHRARIFKWRDHGLDVILQPLAAFFIFKNYAIGFVIDTFLATVAAVIFALCVLNGSWSQIVLMHTIQYTVIAIGAIRIGLLALFGNTVGGLALHTHSLVARQKLSLVCADVIILTSIYVLIAVMSTSV